MSFVCYALYLLCCVFVMLDIWYADLFDIYLIWHLFDMAFI